MMDLAHPWLLLLWLAIPALLWLRFHRHRTPWLYHSRTSTFEGLPVSWTVRLRHLPACLYAPGLTLLVLAMARPAHTTRYTRLHSEGVDIMLVVDTSTSMLAEDFATGSMAQLNRLDAVKIVAKEFVRNRPHDRIGLINFAGLAFTSAPLTFDHAWLIERIEELRPGMLRDGTAIGDGLAAALNRLRDSQAESRVVVLLTDGVNNTGHISPMNAAHLAKAKGIRVYTVGAGTDGLARIPIQTPFGTQYVRERSDIDEPLLIDMAEMTGGRYFRATSLEELDRIYAEIDELETTELEMEYHTRREERFMPFLMLATGLLLLDTLLSCTRWGRLP